MEVCSGSRLRPALSGAPFFQVKAAAVCPAGLQKGDLPGKVAVYGGILPPEQGLHQPADLFPAALTCENEGAVSGSRPDGWKRCRGQDTHLLSLSQHWGLQVSPFHVSGTACEFQRDPTDSYRPGRIPRAPASISLPPGLPLLGSVPVFQEESRGPSRRAGFGVKTWKLFQNDFRS